MLSVLVTNKMNKHILFQELAEHHLVLVTIFVSLHPLALKIIEDNCSRHSAQHLQDEVTHLPDMAPSSQHISYPLDALGLHIGFKAVYLSLRLLLMLF